MPADGKDRSKIQAKKQQFPNTATTATTTTVKQKTPRKGKLVCASMLSGRPDFHGVFWDLFDQAEGETGIAVCGPRGLSTTVRSAVTRVSDQRAVHEGTGAQGDLSACQRLLLVMAMTPRLSKHVYFRVANSHLPIRALMADHMRQRSLRTAGIQTSGQLVVLAELGRCASSTTKQNRATRRGGRAASAPAVSERTCR